MVGESEDPLHVIKTRLEYEGFEVVAAPDGKGALAAASIERPDLVILDVQSPGPDDLDVCRRIRSEAEMPQLPILILIGKGDPVETVLAREQGADDFITKPFDPPELIIRVKA